MLCSPSSPTPYPDPHNEVVITQEKTKPLCLLRVMQRTAGSLYHGVNMTASHEPSLITLSLLPPFTSSSGHCEAMKAEVSPCIFPGRQQGGETSSTPPKGMLSARLLTPPCVCRGVEKGGPSTNNQFLGGDVSANSLDQVHCQPIRYHAANSNNDAHL